MRFQQYAQTISGHGKLQIVLFRVQLCQHTGLYIEERFPMFGVRYIAINDNVDTENAESNDLMPFKNLFNEWFIRDTSRKIRAVQKSKVRNALRLKIRILPSFPKRFGISCSG